MSRRSEDPVDRKGQKTLEEVCAEVARKHRRYDPEAYLFVFESLDHAIAKLGERRHLTGSELSLAARDLAVERFGFLARTVLEAWGVTRTDDFGEIVYHLIDDGVMSKTDEDKKSDFDGVYDFHEAFDLDYFKPSHEPPKP